METAFQTINRNEHREAPLMRGFPLPLSLHHPDVVEVLVGDVARVYPCLFKEVKTVTATRTVVVITDVTDGLIDDECQLFLSLVSHLVTP